MAIADDMKKLAEDIIASHDGRAKTLAGLAADTHKILGESRRIVKTFAQERKDMASKQAESLSNFIKDLTKEVGNKLKEFTQEHSQMSDAMRKDLAEYVRHIARSTKDILDGARNLLGEYRTDIAKAKDAWQSMTRILERSRKTAVAPKTESAEVSPKKKKRKKR